MLKIVDIGILAAAPDYAELIKVYCFLKKILESVA